MSLTTRLPAALPIAGVLALSLFARALAADEAAWQPVYADEPWYKEQPGAEKVWAGVLEAVPEAGPGTLMRAAFYRLGDRTLYTGGKRHPALDALVSKPVEIRGKGVEMDLEGRNLKELWPGAVRPRK